MMYANYNSIIMIVINDDFIATIWEKYIEFILVVTEKCYFIRFDKLNLVI